MAKAISQRITNLIKFVIFLLVIKNTIIFKDLKPVQKENNTATIMNQNISKFYLESLVEENNGS